MNSTIYSADRATHRRIVAVAMAISLVIFGILLSSPLSTERAAKIANAQAPKKTFIAERTAALFWQQL